MKFSTINNDSGLPNLNHKSELLACRYIKPLAENFFMVQGPNQARFPYCNGFLVQGTETVLIDAGVGHELIRAIDRIRRIDVLIISHSHPDHILAWSALADRYLLLPQETPESVKDLQLLGERYTGSPENGSHWAEAVANRLKVKPLRDPDHRFAHHEILDFGKIQIRAIHAPGHLNDHYGFFEEKSGVLLTTDVDFTSFGPWYGNPEGDIELFRLSIKQLSQLPASVVCSSHKPPIYDNINESFTRFDKLFSRQRQLVLDLCTVPRTLTELTALSPFYQNRLYDKFLQRVFETNMIRKNLTLLIRDGLVIKNNGRYQCAVD